MTDTTQHRPVGWLEGHAVRAGIIPPIDTNALDGKVYVPPNDANSMHKVVPPWDGHNEDVLVNDYPGVSRGWRWFARAVWVFIIVGAIAGALWGCAPSPVADPYPDRSPRQHWAQDATRDCAGPWKEWTRQTTFQQWPYHVGVTITVRCLKDASFKGPYTFDGDPL